MIMIIWDAVIGSYLTQVGVSINHSRMPLAVVELAYRVFSLHSFHNVVYRGVMQA